jgi:hypothetical protein
MLKDKYFKELQKRSKEKRISKPYQLTGLEIADILKDKSHTSLYIKLAKAHDAAYLLRAAKEVAENRNVQKKGAYFMRIITGSTQRAKPGK